MLFEDGAIFLLSFFSTGFHALSNLVHCLNSLSHCFVELEDQVVNALVDGTTTGIVVIITRDHILLLCVCVCVCVWMCVCV